MQHPQDLNNRVSNLEKRITDIEDFLEKKDSFSAAPSQAAKVIAKESPPTQKSTPSGPSPMGEFIKWCKDDWLMKLGAFLLLLALGWFVTYAFVNNWIGPMGRITLGILAGAGIMVTGNYIIPKKRNPGQVLVVLGGIMVLLTIFAARVAYDFFTPISALAMMSVVVVGMATIAVLHNAKSIAILALIGGAAVPILIKSPDPQYLLILSYIFVLNLGTILVAALRGWRDMIFLALIMTGIYSVMSFSSIENIMGLNIVWLFMTLFFSTFFISNIAAIIRTHAATKTDLLTTAINGLLLLFWIYEFVPRESASLILSGLVIVLVGVSYLLVKFKGLKSALYIHAALAILFLGAATAFELEGETLIIAFAIEALMIVALAAYLLKDSKSAQAVSLIQLIPVAMAFPLIMNGGWTQGPLLNESFFAVLIVILSLSATTYILKQKETTDQKMPLATIHGIAAAIFSIALIWLSCHNLFASTNIARGVALVIYSVIGVAILFSGTYTQNKPQTLVGGILLASVVIRLLFVEVWTMSLAGKIITFVAIGILLVSTAFFQKRITHPNK